VTDLPPLLSIRGWTEVVDPEYMRFVDLLRETGQEVVDVFVSHEGFESFGEWASAIADEVAGLHRDDRPLHLLGYCGGGTLLHVALRDLESRGIAPDYVGFIDVRAGEPGLRLRRGYDSLFRVPPMQRVRFQLVRLVPPDREPFLDVLESVVRRSLRSMWELPRRGWRSSKQQIPSVQRQSELAARWEFNSIRTPVYAYNCRSSIARYRTADPSLGRAPLLRGGFVVRYIDGDHNTCVEPPYSEALIAMILADRRTGAF
jgi:thioesterase domain-containing protein